MCGRDPEDWNGTLERYRGCDGDSWGVLFFALSLWATAAVLLWILSYAGVL